MGNQSLELPRETLEEPARARAATAPTMPPRLTSVSATPRIYNRIQRGAGIACGRAGL